MKKIYIFTLLLISGFSIKAQLTLTQSSLPLPGDIDVQNSVTNTLVSLGSSGTGQTWNYAGLNVSWSASYSQTYVTMSSVSNASLFPTGTIGAQSSPSYQTVYENTSTYSKVIGSAAPSVSNCMTYSNPITMMTFPFTFGSSYTDTYGYSFSGTTGSGTVTVSGDGTGLLLTPGMSFPNVLKVRYSYTEISTTGTLTSTNTGIQDTYYSSLNKFPLLTVWSSTYSSSSSTVISIGSGAQINRYAFVGIQEEIKETDFSIFPNPTSNHEVTINFSANETDNYSVKVINTIGQEVKNFELSEIAPGQHSKTVNLQDLTSGVYFIKLKNKTSESTRKLIIE